MSGKFLFFYRNKIEIVIFVFLVLSLMPRFLFAMPDMDEIWNYQFSRRILYGFIPYRDFFMMATPLSAQINAALLFLFNDELIVFKSVALFVASIQGLILFKTLRFIGNDELKSFIFISIFICLVALYPHNNYSWFAILFLSLAMYLDLQKTRTLNCNNFISIEFLIGTILGLATITKQNVGILGLMVSVAITLYYYFIVKMYSLKTSFSGLFAKIAGWIIILGIEITYLWNNGSLKYFYEQTVQNPMKFAQDSAMHYYTLFTNYHIIYAVLGLLLPFIIFSLLIRILFTNKNHFKNIEITVLLYSIANAILLYPLSDPTHLILAFVLPVVGFSLLFIEKADNTKLEIKALRFYLFIAITMVSFYVLGSMLNYNYNYVLDANHYKKIHVTKNIALKLEEIDSYILAEKQKGKQIYFLNYQSSFYLIPLDIFNYKSDSMLRSDLDRNVENQIIKGLSDPNNNNIVIVRGEELMPNRQEPETFVNYVRNNMNYLTSIQNFDIYTN